MLDVVLQDFKTAHLLGVAPSSKLVAMLIGSAASVPLSVAAYQLYTSAWQVRQATPYGYSPCPFFFYNEEQNCDSNKSTCCCHSSDVEGGMAGV